MRNICCGHDVRSRWLRGSTDGPRRDRGASIHSANRSGGGCRTDQRRRANARTKDQSVFVPTAGYKLRMDRGENVYCTKIVVLGSRFPKEVCRTEAELRNQENQRTIFRAEMEQRTRVCSGADCTIR